MNATELRTALEIAGTGFRTRLNRSGQLDYLIPFHITLYGALELFDWARTAEPSTVVEGTTQIGTGTEPQLFGIVVAVIATLGGYAALASSDESDPGSTVEERSPLPLQARAVGRLLGNFSLQSFPVALCAGLVIVGIVYNTGSIGLGLLAAAGTSLVFCVGYVAGSAWRVLLRGRSHRLLDPDWLQYGTQGLFVVVLVALASSWWATEGGVMTPGMQWLSTVAIAYASVVFGPMGASPQPTGIALVCGSLIVVAAGTVVGYRFKTAQLSQTNEQNSQHPPTTTPVPFQRTPSTRTAWLFLLRSARNPGFLSHLSILIGAVLIVGGSSAVYGVAGPAVWIGLGVTAGTVIAGNAFCFAQFGDTSGQRRFLGSSTTHPQRHLYGGAIAGLLLGGIVSLGIGLPIALVWNSGFDPLTLLVVAVALLFASVGIALGLSALEQPELQPDSSWERRTRFLRGSHQLGGVVASLFGLVLAWEFAILELPLADSSSVVAYFGILTILSTGGYLYARKRIKR